MAGKKRESQEGGKSRALLSRAFFWIVGEVGRSGREGEKKGSKGFHAVRGRPETLCPYVPPLVALRKGFFDIGGMAIGARQEESREDG